VYKDIIIEKYDLSKTHFFLRAAFTEIWAIRTKKRMKHTSKRIQEDLQK
jgi:hypothetical protein